MRGKWLHLLYVQACCAPCPSLSFLQPSQCPQLFSAGPGAGSPQLGAVSAADKSLQLSISGVSPYRPPHTGRIVAASSRCGPRGHHGNGRVNSASCRRHTQTDCLGARGWTDITCRRTGPAASRAAAGMMFPWAEYAVQRGSLNILRKRISRSGPGTLAGA